MKRSDFLATISAPLLSKAALTAQASTDVDVVIYGGTPAGLAAARAVVREGATAIVIEPSTHIGGMVTGGIAITDTGTPHLVGGISAEFFDEVAAERRKAHPNPQKPVLHFRGRQMEWRPPRIWDLEPKTARMVFDRWVRQDGYKLITNRRVRSVNKTDGRITSIRLTNGSELSGKVFIDASYEGDLMALARVPYTYGREAKQQYKESLAGVRAPHFKANYSEDVYRTPGIEYMHHGQFGADIKARDSEGNLLWGIESDPLKPEGSADKKIQAYCFRLIATQREDLKVPWPKPRRYYPERYELLLRYIQEHPEVAFARLVHLGAIPNGKFDLNASGPFSIDYVGGNRDYPDGDYATRDRIYRDHEDYQQGFLWFLAHDPRVPKIVRDDVNTWGLVKDEYTDTGHWPTQLYIRECRRLVGDHVMTEHDILHEKRKSDSVGMGSFVLDSHWVQRIPNEQGFVRIEGHLDESIRLDNAPYEIAYRSLTPKVSDCRNLMVPVCMSATHVAICTIRMEPVYMVLGHSAGVAAVMAARGGKPVQEIETSKLLGRLAEQGQVLHKEDARKL